MSSYHPLNFRDSRSLLRFAFGQNFQAAFSTIDIGGILSNVANKFLLEGFFNVPVYRFGVYAGRGLKSRGVT